MTVVFAVAAGGALGALGRYLVLSWLGHRLGFGFPFGTLAVNVSGSFLAPAYCSRSPPRCGMRRSR